ncbi:uncharacterized protein dmt [Halyomorpha halys]|uniref:uncharacterized protein dmt n=1 Tax=Halyomorpha halys TaxID=286706 RepID=UPI0006D4FC21|nr:uncharacterized protein LOC106691395 [Halyomorpha halys]
MGRLVRSRTKVQKPDAENIPPADNIKKSRRGKVTSKNVDKIETGSAAEATPGPSSAKTATEDKIPVYLSLKKSLTRRSLKGIQERLNMYDFEVDENEPVVKKSKRKPITKVKKQRTYKKKFKFLPETSIILEDVGKENVHPISKAVTPSKKAVEASNPLAEISNIIIEDNIDLSIDAAVHSRRLTLYSPPPYRSPKRDSVNVPIVRTSDCTVPGNVSSRSINVSLTSNKHDKSDCSTYSGGFMNQLFMGSSTPIRSHWAEDSAPYVTPKPATQYGNFNLSNNFGLEGEEIDEPFVSPIKSATTPSHNISIKTPVKQSPVKVPFEQVVKILKFGTDAPEDSDVNLFEGLPDNFYHDGDTPTYSPLPFTPERPKNHRRECLPSTSKAKHVQFQDESDDSGLTQSSEDKSTQSKCDIVYSYNKKNLKKLKEDKDIGYETEDQVSTKRQPRRSYERPVYLRTKKKVTPYGIDTVEDDDHDHEETISKKTAKKKNCGLSKKEALEMEKWAKAFNEQCMQVENFNLCVE